MRVLLADLRHNCGPKYTDVREHLPMLLVLRTVLTARFGAVFLFRLSQTAGRLFGPLGSAVKQLNQLLTGADIAWQAKVGAGLVLFHPVGVVIGEYVSLGKMVAIQQGVTIGGNGGWNQSSATSPRIGDSVQLGAGCRIIGGIGIGDSAVVGANAVVTKDVPNGAVAVGIPATWRHRQSVMP